MKQEVYELSEKAYPPGFKQAIEWGPGYYDAKAIENLIDWYVSKYLMEPEVAAHIKRNLYIKAELDGIAAFEDITRQDSSRYAAISQIRGAKIDEANRIEPLGDIKGEKFDSAYYTLYDEKGWNKVEGDLKLYAEKIRKKTILVNVVVGEGHDAIKVEIPKWLFILYSTIYKTNLRGMEISRSRWDWYTRKRMMKEATDKPTRDTIDAYHNLLQRLQMELIGLHREKMQLERESTFVENKKRLAKGIKGASKKKLKIRVKKDAKEEPKEADTEEESR